LRRKGRKGSKEKKVGREEQRMGWEGGKGRRKGKLDWDGGKGKWERIIGSKDGK
jgi:hypothetical protein